MTDAVLTRGAGGVLALALALAVPGAAGAAPGDGAWHFFGDSSTDTGNGTVLEGGEGGDFRPYSANGALMRISNGPVWAEQLGREVDPVLAPDRDSRNLNFAVGGARWAAEDETGVLAQIAYLEALVAEGEIVPGPDDLAFVFAGTNDLATIGGWGRSEARVIADMAAAGAEAMTRLGALGLRTVLVAEPLAIGLSDGLGLEARQALRPVTDAAAGALFAAAGAAAAEAGVTLVRMPVRDWLDEVQRAPEAHGFADVETPCFDGESLCAADRAGQNRFFFFDEIHPSEGGHGYIAGRARALIGAMPGG